jgi:hypothetical protein
VVQDHARSGTTQRSKSMSRRMQIQEVTEIYKNLETKLSDKTWTDTLNPDDLKLITDVKDMAENLISQVYIFIDYFHQYVDIVQASAIFSPDYHGEESNNAEVYPTQTSAAPANRAEKRAAAKLIVP